MNKSGIIDHNEIWQGEVLVTGDIVIHENVTVTIRPGCRLTFAADGDFSSDLKRDKIESLNAILPDLSRKAAADRCHILVKGRLTAVGTADDPILIGNPEWRGGIFFYTDSISKKPFGELRHCAITHGDYPVAVFGGSAAGGGDGVAVSLADNDISNSLCGLFLNAYCRVRGNHVHDSEYGIAFFDTPAGGRCATNTVERCTQAGIFCVRSAPLIEGNELRENNVGVKNWMIGREKGTGGVTVRGNRILKNQTGISSREVFRCGLFDNEIAGNGAAMVIEEQVGSVTVRGNRFADNGGGISCGSETGVEITANEFAGGAVGIKLQGKAGGDVTDNRFTAQSHAGVLCFGAVDLTLRGNTVGGAAAFLQAGESAVLRITDNSVTAATGITLAGNCDGTVTGNTIRCGTAGLVLRDQSRGELTANEISGDSVENTTGIEIGTSSPVELKDNRISGLGAGIRCSGEARVRIEEGSITGCARGLEADGSSSIEARSCCIDDPAECCVQLLGHATADIEGSMLRGPLAIAAGGASTVRAAGNAITAVVEGISCREEAKAEIVANRISGAPEGKTVGIAVNGLHAAITGNNLLEALETGLRCGGASRVTIDGAGIQAGNVGLEIGDTSTVEVRRCRISSGGQSVRCSSAANSSLEECELQGRFGIDASGTSSVRLGKNRISVTDTGIFFREQSSGKIIESEISGSGEEATGMEISGEGEFEIAAASLSNLGRGVRCHGTARVTVVDTTLECRGPGIEISGEVAAAVRNCTIASAGAGGVLFCEKAVGEVSGSAVSGLRAIEVSGTGTANLSATRVTAAEVGISYGEQACGTVTETMVTGGGAEATGIEINGACTVTFKGCELKGVEKGLRTGEEAQVTAEGLRISSRRTGIEAGGMSVLKLSGATVTSAAETAVRCIMNAGGEVRGSELSGLRAVEMSGSSVVTLAGNRITGVEAGIVCQEQASCTITDNAIAGTEGRETTGIEINGAGMVTVTGNELAGVEKGLRSGEEAQVTVEGIRISSRWTGVEAGGMSVVKLSGATVASAAETAVRSAMSAHVEVRGSGLSGLRAVEASGASAMTLADNRITGGEAGIICREQSCGTITGNTVTGTEGKETTGIEINGVCVVTVRGNELSGVEKGLRSGDEAQVTVEGIRISSRWTGIEAGGISGVKVSGATVTSAAETAVRYAMNAGGEVKGCELSGLRAVEAGGASAVTVAGNHIRGGETGIIFREQAGGAVTDNTVTGTGGKETTGIEINGVCVVTVTGNELSDVEKGLRAGEEAQVIAGGIRISSRGTGIEAGGMSVVKISGATVASVSEIAVRYAMSAGGEVRGSELSGLRAVEASGASAVTVAGNRILARETGIIYREQAGGTLTDNTIAGAGGGETTGIEVNGVCAVTVKGNELSGVEKGLRVGEEAQVTVEGIQITSRWTGIEAGGLSTLNLTDGRIESSEDSAVRYAMNAGGEVNASELSGVRVVDLSGTSSVKISGNRITGGETGIFYREQASGEIFSNEITGSEGRETTGIEISDVCEVTVVRNILSNVARGLRCGEESRVRVEDIRIESRGTGIEAGGAGVLTVTDSWVVTPEDSCVRYLMNSSGEVKDSELQGLHGIDISGTAAVTMQGNTIACGAEGVICREQASGKINGCTITGAPGGETTAIEVSGACAVTVAATTVTQVERGLRCADESEVKAEGFRIESRGTGIEAGGMSRFAAVGITVSSAAESALRAAMGASCEAADSELAGIRAVDAGGTGSLKLSGSRISGSEVAVICREQANGEITGCTITGTDGAETTGIEVSGACAVTVAATTVTQVEKGLRCADESEVKAEGFRVESRGTGIEAGGMSRLAAVGTTVRSAAESALRLVMGAGCDVADSELSGKRAVDAGGTGSMKLSGSRISGSEAVVICREQANGEITGCTITGAEGGETIGIEVSGVCSVSVDATTMTLVERGLRCADESEVRASGLTIESRGTGLEAGGMSRLAAGGITVTSAAESAVRVVMGAACEVADSGLSGVRAADAGGNGSLKLSGSRLTGAEAVISCCEQANGEITGCTIAGVEGRETTGIELRGVCAVSAGETTVANVEKGLRCAEEARLTAVRLTIESRGAGIEAGGMCQIELTQSCLASAAESCLRFLAGSSGEVSRCELRGGRGIDCSGTSVVKVNAGTLSCAQAGISFREQAGGEITETAINGADAGEATGVEVMGACSVTLRGGLLSNLAKGLRCGEEAQVRIEGTRIESRGTGVEADGISSFSAATCRIASAADSCLRVLMNAGCKMEQSELEGLRGIDASGTSTLMAAGNRITCVEVGVSCREQAGGEIRANRICGAAGAEPIGIEAFGIGEIAVLENELTAVDKGFYCGDEAQVRFEKNTVESRRGGVEASGIAALSIRDCVIVSGTDGCVRYGMSASGEVLSSTLEGLRGIDAAGTSSVRIRGNTITAGETGIGFREQAGGEVTENAIASRGGQRLSPIYIDDMADPKIKRNTAAGGAAAEVVYGINARARSESAGRPAAAEKGRARIRRTRQEARPASGFRASLRRFVLRTWQFAPLNLVYRSIYRLSIRVFVGVMRRRDLVEGIYLRRGLTSADWIPGSSDIDYFILLGEAGTERSAAALRSIWDGYYALKKCFPFLGEVQIGTRRELDNYLRCGDLRAAEAAHAWLPLLGGRLNAPVRTPSKEKFSADCLTEVLNSYRLLSEAYFNRDILLNARQLFLKSFIDMLKHSIFIRDGRSRRFGSRGEIIETYRSAGYCGPQDRILLDKIALAWSRNIDVSESLYHEAFAFMFAVADETVRAASGVLLSAPGGKPAFRYETAAAPASGDPVLAEEWESFCCRLEASSEGTLDSLILEDPGLLYVILDDGAQRHRGFAGLLHDMRNCIGESNSTKDTPFLFLTRSMFQGLLLSLHLETPFNSLMAGGGPQRHNVAVVGLEDERKCNVAAGGYAALQGPLLQLLIKEAIAIMTISIRMHERSTVYDNRHRLVYLLRRVLAFRLALEKRIIAGPYLEQIVATYRREYPESAAWLDGLSARYLSADRATLAAVDPRQLFYEWYPPLREILDRLTIIIHEDD